MSDVFVLPDPGEGLTEADIVSWKVAPGDAVTVNQILVEIETAKSLVELPSPHAGTIAELLVTEGATVEVGTPIVRFGGADSGTAAEAAPASAAPAASAAGDGAAGEAAGDDSASGGATLVGYGAVASSSKRRPRKAGAAPAQPAAVPQAAAGASGGAASAATTRNTTTSTDVLHPHQGRRRPGPGTSPHAFGASYWETRRTARSITATRRPRWVHSPSPRPPP